MFEKWWFQSERDMRLIGTTQSRRPGRIGTNLTIRDAGLTAAIKTAMGEERRPLSQGRVSHHAPSPDPQSESRSPIDWREKRLQLL